MSSNAHFPINPFAAQQRLLRERLYFLLADLHPRLKADVMRALEERGKLLSQSHTDADSEANPPAGVWSMLTLLVAQYISPDIDSIYASSVAIAVECFICALDLLDDIEDEDQTPVVQALGVARTLNVSTTLLMMAQRAILSLLQQSVAPSRILLFLDTLQASAIVATAGQHRDLLAEQRVAQDLSYEECIEIAAAKAGSLMRLACRMGTLCANASDTLCEQFSQLGELLGIAHQLDNDAHDLYYLLQSDVPTVIPTGAGNTTRSIKTDLVQGKKTLPVVLAARTKETLQGPLSQADEEKKEEHLHSLYEGINTTWGICMLYRERACDHLQVVEAQQPISPVLRLLLGL